MGNKPRSSSGRTHRHTDYGAGIRILAEDDLFGLLDSLKEPAFLLILDCVQDPHNLGACLRTANGAGVHAVIMPRDRSVDVTDVVRRVACGAAETTPIVRVTNLSRVLDQLKKAGVWLVGTGAEEARSLYEIDLTGPLAIIMGSEGKGMRRLTADKCDFLVNFPMRGTVESLNVSVSTGICLFEALRQRLAKDVK
ncbi:MAG: 23S rRNA (guanosine(2251)-2'-O)-methyltransferase RlmB [candidate division Zixibacteria bacterium]|nr:23S rRNA (guanosine(2251)-2'-O)-methyltransferase RlmB [candidate division Zixibacteria bacterium]